MSYEWEQAPPSSDEDISSGRSSSGDRSVHWNSDSDSDFDSPAGPKVSADEAALELADLLLELKYKWGLEREADLLHCLVGFQGRYRASFSFWSCFQAKCAIW